MDVMSCVNLRNYCYVTISRNSSPDFWATSLNWWKASQPRLSERPRDPHPFPATGPVSEQTKFHAEMVLSIELRQQEASDYIQMG